MAASLLLQTWPEEGGGAHRPRDSQRADAKPQRPDHVRRCAGLVFRIERRRAIRTGLYRAYAVRDKRAWWVLRMEAVGFVLLGAWRS